MQIEKLTDERLRNFIKKVADKEVYTNPIRDIIEIITSIRTPYILKEVEYHITRPELEIYEDIRDKTWDIEGREVIARPFRFCVKENISGDMWDKQENEIKEQFEYILEDNYKATIDKLFKKSRKHENSTLTQIITGYDNSVDREEFLEEHGYEYTGEKAGERTWHLGIILPLIISHRTNSVRILKPVGKPEWYDG